MYTNILVAVDGSAVSDAALNHAILLAQDQHAKLHVVHVVDIVGMPWDEVDVQTMLTIYRQQGQSILDRAMASATRAGLIATATMLETQADGARVAEMLANKAQEIAADLVVLGSHGHRGLTRLFSGSVAEGTSRLCSAPVMIVHGPPSMAT